MGTETFHEMECVGMFLRWMVCTAVLAFGVDWAWNWAGKNDTELPAAEPWSKLNRLAGFSAEQLQTFQQAGPTESAALLAEDSKAVDVAEGEAESEVDGVDKCSRDETIETCSVFAIACVACGLVYAMNLARGDQHPLLAVVCEAASLAAGVAALALLYSESRPEHWVHVRRTARNHLVSISELIARTRSGYLAAGLLLLTVSLHGAALHSKASPAVHTDRAAVSFAAAAWIGMLSLLANSTTDARYNAVHYSGAVVFFAASIASAFFLAASATLIVGVAVAVMLGVATACLLVFVVRGIALFEWLGAAAVASATALAVFLA